MSDATQVPESKERAARAKKQISKAKIWCEEARKLLGLRAYSPKGREISSRSSKVVKELTDLRKALQSGKAGISPAELKKLEGEFVEIATKLKTAAKKDDVTKAEQYLGRLSELKKKLAVHLAKDTKSKAKAEAKLGVREKANKARDDLVAKLRDRYKAALAEAEKALADLNLNAHKALVRAERKQAADHITSAKGKAAKHDYESALADLEDAKGTCEKADKDATVKAQYNALLAVREVNAATVTGHTHEALIPDWVRKVSEALAKAKRSAAAGHYGTAVEKLNELPQLCAAGRLEGNAAGKYAAAHTSAVNGVNNLKAHRGRKPIEKQVEDLKKLLKAAEAKCKAKQIEEALYDCESIVGDYYWRYKRTADDYVKFERLRDTIERTRLKFINEHEHKGLGKISPRVAAINARMELAKENGEAGDYGTGNRNLEEAKAIADEIGPVLAAATNYYDDLRPKAKKAHADLRKLDKGGIIQEDLDEIVKLLGEAKKFANALEFRAAFECLGTVQRLCGFATRWLAKQAGVVADQDGANKKIDKLDKKPDAAIQAVKDLLQKLKDHDRKREIRKQIGLVEGEITKAEKALEKSDTAGADTALKAATRICGEAHLIADRHEKFLTYHQSMKTRFDELKNWDPDEKVLKEEIATGVKKLRDAMGLAKKQDHGPAFTIIREVGNLISRARSRFDASDVAATSDANAGNVKAFELLEERTTKFTDEIAALKTQDSGLDVIVPEIERLEAMVARAKELAAKGDYKGANALLDPNSDLKAIKEAVDKVFPHGKRCDNNLKWARRRLAKVKVLAGKAGITAEITALEKLFATLEQKHQDRLYEASLSLIDDFEEDADKAEAKAKAYEKHQTDLKPTQDAVRDVAKVPHHKAIRSEIKAIQVKLAAAEALGTALDYAGAVALFAEIDTLIAAAKALADEKGPYLARLKLVKKKVADLKGLNPAEAVALQQEKIKAKWENATDLGDREKFDEADKLLDEIETDCNDAAATTKDHGTFTEAEAEAKKVSRHSTDDLKNTLETLRALYDRVTGKLGGTGPAGSEIAEKLLEVDGQLEEAKQAIDASKGGDAKKLLKQAAAGCGQANVMAAQQLQYQASRTAADKSLADNVKKHKHAAVLGPDIEKIEKLLGRAGRRAGAGKYGEALAAVNSAVTACDDAVKLGDSFGKYDEAHKKVPPEITKLVEHKQKYAIVKDLDEIRANLAAAEAKAKERDYEEAMKLLDKAATGCTSAEIMADMHGNAIPDKAALEALLAKEGGPKAIDKIVASLGPQTKREVLKAAIEVRFDIELKMYESKDETTAADMAERAPNLRRIYDVMSGVPDSHTKDNASLKKVARHDETGASFYRAREQLVALKCGRTDVPERERLGNPNELLEVEDRCQPKDDSPVKAFNYTTLHEVGHAVDNKNGFMKSKEGNTAFGGWKTYGKDPSEPAKAAAKEFGYNEKYIAQFLTGSKPKPPDPPKGTTPEDWERLRARVEDWCNGILVDASLWYDGSATAKRAIGKRVYQQSYSWQWVSYDLGERGKGITGYQFRAPGEWFAEIYAAYHSGKLKDGHPAAGWLKDLDRPEGMK